MANLEKVIKVTQSQYDILASGGTVGSYTGLDDNYIYLIEDNNTYITSNGGVIDGGNIDFASGYGIASLNANDNVTAGFSIDYYGGEIIYNNADHYRDLFANDNYPLLYSENSDYLTDFTFGTALLKISDDSDTGASMSFDVQTAAINHNNSGTFYSAYLPNADGTLALESYVQANPQTTTATLTGIKIGNTSYAIPSGPSTYLKTASVSGNTLTLTKQDNTTVTYTPSFNEVPTTTTANKLLVSTSTSGTEKWSDWSSAGFLKTNSSGVVSVDTNTYLTTTGKAADADKLDGNDSTYFLNTSSTSQSKSGSITFSGNTYIGDGTTNSRALGDAPYQTKFLDFERRTGVLRHLNVFSGVGDHLFNADRKPGFTIRTSFKGSGTDTDTYKADLYTYGVDSTGSYPSYLFDWSYNTGWQVLPSKVSVSTPAIIEVKCSSRLNYTDVLRLVLTGHNGYDGSSNYSGILTDYKIEVCTDYTNDTWVSVVERTGVQDKIGLCPQYSLQTSNYTACFGIRLTITGCSVTGSGYDYIKISSMQLRNHRPDYTIPESVGALSLRGGTMYGSITMGGPSGQSSILTSENNKGNIGSSTAQFYKIYGGTFYENGTALDSKYVTLTGPQTISGTKTISNSLILNNNVPLQGKDTNGTARSLIHMSGSNNVVIDADGIGDIVTFASVRPATTKDGAVNLGSSAGRWKNLYLSESLTDGTNSITIANIQSKVEVKRFI